MQRHGLSAADLHIHTTASDGTATPLEVLEWVSAYTDIRVIAICDHNTVDGAHEAASLARDYPVEVIVGQEVESADGHILGLWTPERIEPCRSAVETIADIHDQGGLAIIAHPFAPLWWHRHGLRRGERSIYDTCDFDGVECANSTPLLFLANYLARRYWKSHRSRLAATGGSDAHIIGVIGTSRTLFPGSTASELRHALERRETAYFGPKWSLTRAWQYWKRVPEIRERSNAMQALAVPTEAGPATTLGPDMGSEPRT